MLACQCINGTNFRLFSYLSRTLLIMTQVFRSSLRSTISKKSPITAAIRQLPQLRHISSHAIFPSLKPFLGKVITVTGAARGIGLATARYLAARGATICISNVRGKDLEKAEEGIFKDFPDVNVRRAVVDVSKSAEVNKWIEDVRFEFGELNGCQQCWYVVLLALPPGLFLWFLEVVRVFMVRIDIV